MNLLMHLQQINFGDKTPRLQGRLNLNPLSHIDPMGFIFLIVAGFGWGKPVQIDSRNFNGKYSLSKAEAIVAVAGPIMNFILAFVFLILYYILFFTFKVFNGLSAEWYAYVNQIFIYIVTINIGLGVFNLIPLPPLDGSKVLMHFLPSKAKMSFYKYQEAFYFAFVIILITGLADVVIVPIFNLLFSGMNWLVYALLNLVKLI